MAYDRRLTVHSIRNDSTLNNNTMGLMLA